MSQRGGAAPANSAATTGEGVARQAGGAGARGAGTPGADRRGRAAYDERKARVAEVVRSGNAAVGLAKPTSNLFRDRTARRAVTVNLAEFHQVIAVDASAGTVETEAMATYESLVDATLAAGTMPCVVPQLRTITIGGATVGVGIESSSFRHGLVHEGVVELDVLLADGQVVTCRADNAHADLFFGFPNSYGTLGYALRVEARTQPVRRFVRLANLRHREPATFFADLEARASGDADFLDGVVFGDDELYVIEGRFADEAPYTSDYTYSRIYYRSIRERAEDWLTVRDYLWRWDTDWFWCSKNVGAQNPLLRRLFGRKRLNSRTYQRIMRWNSRVGLTRALDRIRGLQSESVIQDVDIPIARAAEFLAFLRADVGILPIWVCPFRPGADADRRVLFPLRPGALYVNFGFWDVVRHRERRPPGECNRRIEARATALGGIKSLYSDSYFTPAEFDAAYGGAAYAALKRKYDPDGRFPTLYQKCVQRH